MDEIKEQIIEKINSEEIFNIVKCIDKAERAGVLIEVVYNALEEMKANPSSSSLLCLQIALNNWDC